MHAGSVNELIEKRRRVHPRDGARAPIGDDRTRVSGARSELPCLRILPRQPPRVSKMLRLGRRPSLLDCARHSARLSTLRRVRTDRLRRLSSTGNAAPSCSTRGRCASLRRGPGEGGAHRKRCIRMLCVPTYLAPSRISGLGLFAATQLQAGTRLWEFTHGVDWRIQPEELAAFPEPFQAQLRHYVYREQDGTYVLCGDNAKFMNHDEEPNCSDADPVYTIVRRTVRAGEELTCNYLEFDEDSRRAGLPWVTTWTPPSVPSGPRRVVLGS